eukprot:UN03898
MPVLYNGYREFRTAILLLLLIIIQVLDVFPNIQITFQLTQKSILPQCVSTSPTTNTFLYSSIAARMSCAYILYLRLHVCHILV